MKTVLLLAGLMIFSFLGTASSDLQPTAKDSVPSIDFNAPASGPSCVAQTSAESRAVEPAPILIDLAASGYCYNDCSTCYPVGSLCSNGRGKCTSVPLC
jgi:hypothetical protein